ISLAAAVLLLLPRIGLLSATDFNERTNFASVIYVAGILSLGTVLAETGVGNALERLLLELLPLSPGADAANFASLAGLSTLLSMAVTTTAAPAVLGPLSQEMAAATGLPLLTTLMIHVIGYSTVMLPYQVPPVIVAMQLGGVGTGPAVRVTLTLAAVTWVVLLPINYLWWRALGYL
ncbi:MAG: SLC13 family permease, partial [Geminicoccales bacterium]